jgi:hypothetical protein
MSLSLRPGLFDFLGSFNKVDVVPTIERNLDRLEIRYKWADSKAARMAGFGNIVTGCVFLAPILFISSAMLGTTGDPIFFLFLVPFFGFAAYFVYHGLATLLNWGTIIVDGTTLVSSDRPLPLNLTAKVATSNIKRVYASYIVVQTKHGYYKIHLVRVLTNDGHDKIVDKGISETNAALFASEISKHLKLDDGPFGLDLGSVTKEPGRLAIEYRSKENATSTNLAMLAFGLLWSGFVLFFNITLVLSTPESLIFLLFMTPFTAIGVFFLYYSIGRMRNRSSIIIDQGSLVAKERPLPFSSTKKLRIEDVQEFVASTPGAWSTPNKIRLDALTKSGKHISIARGLSEEQAFMFVQEIHGFLGIKARESDQQAYLDPQASSAPISLARRRGMNKGAKIMIVFVVIFMVSIFGFFAIMMSGVFESQESGGLRIAYYDGNYVDFDGYSYGAVEFNVTIENTIDVEVTKTIKLTLNYQGGSTSEFQTVTLAPYETRTFTYSIYHSCDGSESISCSFWNM